MVVIQNWLTIVVGFFPDNGGAYFLSHLKGELGTYLGLTSAQLKGSDAYHAGLATHYISSQSVSFHFSKFLDLYLSANLTILLNIYSYCYFAMYIALLVRCRAGWCRQFGSKNGE